MSRKAKLPQTRHHNWIYNEDWQWALEYAAQHEGLTPSTLIRELFHSFVLQQKALQKQANEDAKL